MNEHQNESDTPVSELDLRGVICPYNFVKTKLKLETLEQGQVLSVLLDDGDPIRNVPRSVQNEGHT
ncbi:MAG: sulfurtransferase TusA family protein, partial [Nitrospira sp.]